jgi:hypothetical protein
MRIPALASALNADWAPGPGVFEPFPASQNGSAVPEVGGRRQMSTSARNGEGYGGIGDVEGEGEDVPPVARILMCRAVIPNSLHRVATS